MSNESGISIILLFLLVFLSASVLSTTVAQSRQYHLDQEWIKIWINQDGSIDLFYNISITLDSGDSINFIKVGQPQGDFTIGNATDQYGHLLSTSDASSASDYKVQVNLDSPLIAGQTIWFTVTTNVAKMIYEDNEPNVGMQFRPTWWSEATVTDLRVSIVLPAGVAQSQIATSVNWDNVLPEDDRWAVLWERTDLAPNQQYDFGVSFPKEYVQVYAGAGRVHNLNTGLNYTTIQEAIFANETLDGHVIHVDAGTYFVNNTVYIWINKSISLVGDGRENTTIIATEPMQILYVTSDHVNITGFTMRNGTFGVSASANYVHVTNCNISDNWGGISMYFPYYPGHQLVGEIIEENILMNNTNYGIQLNTNNSIIRRNLISGNGGGISLAPGNGPEELATGNLVYENTIENNGHRGPGCIVGGYNNTIVLNNFLNNTMQAYAVLGTNAWDGRLNPNDLLWGGNFWSDYNETNIYGMGVTPYVIDSGNIDHYPLTGMLRIFDAPYGYEAAVVSNSSISDFEFNMTEQSQATLTFRVAGENDTTGFCWVIIPQALINHSQTWVVKLDGELWSAHEYSVISNQTHWNFWIDYPHSIHQIEITGVTIIPEFPSFLVTQLFMVAALVAIIVFKRRHPT
jgi:hypothetical protein